MNRLLVLVVMFICFGCATTKSEIPYSVAVFECWTESDSYHSSARAMSLKRAQRLAFLKCVKGSKNRDTCELQVCRICRYTNCDKGTYYGDKHE